MKLKTSDLNILHKTAIQAACKAGEALLSFDRKKLKVETKDGASSRASEVVTEVDLLCENIIIKELQSSGNTYNLALLTEETADDKSRFEKEYFWCIDPIDGTLPYIENRSGYANVISLVSKNGEPLVGVVYDPVASVVYSAIRGLGAFKNGNSWKINRESSNKKLVFVFDRSFVADARYDKTLSELTKYAEGKGFAGVEEMQYGGAAMNAIWLANNGEGCYFKFPQDKGGSIWDYAATACIYKELGLLASDIYGNPMELNRKDSTYMNHNGILYATDRAIRDFVIDLNKKLN